MLINGKNCNVGGFCNTLLKPSSDSNTYGRGKLANIQPTFDQHFANMLAKCWMKLLVPFAVFANISPTFGQHLANKFYEIFPRCQKMGKCWANIGQHYQTGLIMLGKICTTLRRFSTNNSNICGPAFCPTSVG